jgi:Lar family restriction alleviation protein
MTMAELKPCPFCGGKAVVYKENGDEMVSIACSECNCGTAYISGASSTEKKIEIAVQDWNRRFDDERKTD